MQVKRYAVPIRKSLATISTSTTKIVEDINRCVRQRGGFILNDGQILTTEVSESDILDYYFHGDESFEPLPKWNWLEKHAAYFEVSNPYQPSEEAGEYDENYVIFDIADPYLNESERILALLDGGRDGLPFYCTCHYSHVVYTSRHRFVCMMCGMLHCVLEKPIDRQFTSSLMAEEWFDYFGYDGTKQDEEIYLNVIDFQDIEDSPKLWVTNQWKEACRELTFFTRSTPEESEKYRGSIITSGQLIEAGFTEVHESPPPIFQLSSVDFSINLISNALGSLNEGIFAYLNGKTQVGQLKFAVVELFHAVELLLKGRLDQLAPDALASNPNNPRVVALLQQNGVTLSADELKTIHKLRLLRNKLQHNKGSYNYRSALSLAHQTLVFIDRFSRDELGLWIAQAIDAQAWQALLSFEPIQAAADRISKEIVEQIEGNDEYVISTCPRCKREALVSGFMEGSQCLYCRHRPTIEEIMPDAFSPDDDSEHFS